MAPIPCPLVYPLSSLQSVPPVSIYAHLACVYASRRHEFTCVGVSPLGTTPVRYWGAREFCCHPRLQRESEHESDRRGAVWPHVPQPGGAWACGTTTSAASSAKGHSGLAKGLLLQRQRQRRCQVLENQHTNTVHPRFRHARSNDRDSILSGGARRLARDWETDPAGRLSMHLNHCTLLERQELFARHTQGALCRERQYWLLRVPDSARVKDKNTPALISLRALGQHHKCPGAPRTMVWFQRPSIVLLSSFYRL